MGQGRWCVVRMIALVSLAVTAAVLVVVYMTQNDDNSITEGQSWVFIGVIMTLMFVIGLLFRPRK